MQQHRQPDPLGFAITVPAGEAPGIYRVSAQSKAGLTG